MKWEDVPDVFAFFAERPGLGLLALLTLLTAIYAVAAIQSAAKGDRGWTPALVSSSLLLAMVALGAVLVGSSASELDPRKMSLKEWFDKHNGG